MNTKLMGVATFALVAAFASQANAQEKTTYFEEPLAAPKKALEIVVGTGYTQGFGSLQQGVDMSQVATSGIGVDMGLGYRITPHWGVAITGQYQEFTAERASSSRGFLPGFAVTYHAAPYTRTDPFIAFGGGYRFLWENQQSPNPTLLTHGFELAKLAIGVDIRVHRDVAIAPVIGADLTLPLWQTTNNATTETIANPSVATYVFAGLQARFDVTSQHELATRSVAMEASPPKVEITRAVIEEPKQEEMKPVSPTINVSEELIEKCKLHFGDVEKAPKFEFDKSQLQSQDYEILTQIAVCLTNQLKDSSIVVLGRADPRGTTEYNDKLGMRRANSVASYIEQLGVTSDRMSRESRGERDAVGTDEASWAFDRRVDISLSH
jgi:outer membrane protein OmpA-like peptidoglycan-associated protein